MADHYVDGSGNYLGYFDGFVPDGGFIVPVGPDDARQTWNFGLEVWEGFTIPKDYKVWDYVADYTGDKSAYPSGLDIETSLTQKLHPVHSFSGGLLSSSIYYADPTDNGDGTFSYDNPIVQISYDYTLYLGTQTVKSDLYQWYFVDETLDTVQETRSRILPNNPILHEVREEAGIPVNMIKNLGFPAEPGDAASKGFVEGLPGGTQEGLMDFIASFLIDGTGFFWTYDDPGDTLQGNVTLDPFTTTDLDEGSNLYFTDERVDDRVNALIQDAGGIRKSYNDAGNQLTLQTAFATQLFSVQDEKAQNTNGGTFTTGAWRTRDLNTVKTNEIAGASLSANQITLPAGTYFCQFSCPASNNNSSAMLVQPRLQDITNNITLVLGKQAGVVKDSIIQSFGGGRFTLPSTATLELQHISDSTVNNIGFGAPGNFTTEIYSSIQIWRLY